MKTIYLKVEVPDEFVYEETTYQVIALNPTPDETGFVVKECEFTELHLPTPEEIDHQSSALISNATKNIWKSGATWLLKQITDEK